MALRRIGLVMLLIAGMIGIGVTLFNPQDEQFRNEPFNPNLTVTVSALRNAGFSELLRSHIWKKSNDVPPILKVLRTPVMALLGGEPEAPCQVLTKIVDKKSYWVQYGYIIDDPVPVYQIVQVGQIIQDSLSLFGWLNDHQAVALHSWQEIQRNNKFFVQSKKNGFIFKAVKRGDDWVHFIFDYPLEGRYHLSMFRSFTAAGAVEWKATRKFLNATFTSSIGHE